jgi:hypothetical protein
VTFFAPVYTANECIVTYILYYFHSFVLLVLVIELCGMMQWLKYLILCEWPYESHVERHTCPSILIKRVWYGQMLVDNTLVPAKDHGHPGHFQPAGGAFVNSISASLGCPHQTIECLTIA